ncbi:MAG TPA: hypothetical protein VFQ44_15560 [Streptosporangiaceae bacterium]|nr:hypothetical protein [Streptosporangiaceae bacterium]
MRRGNHHIQLNNLVKLSLGDHLGRLEFALAGFRAGALCAACR